MGSRSARDGESPSNSILPQLRASRRESIASLSGAAQLDKETLSQALDEIHSTVSQSETLTAFNEYTSPPSSSSGTDSKGIASELSGGLSGLYTRFRASVGNVKDIVGTGGEDVVGEATSVKSPRGAIHSPAPSNKSASGSLRVASSSTAHLSRVSVSASQRQSPVITEFPDEPQDTRTGNGKLSKTSGGSASASSRSVANPFTALKSPRTTLAQAPLSTAAIPALAEVNINATNQPGFPDHLAPNVKSLEDAPQIAGRNDPTQKSRGVTGIAAVTDDSGDVSPDIQTPAFSDILASKMHPNESDRRERNVDFVHQEEPPSNREAERTYSQVSNDTVRLLPRMESEDNRDVVVGSSSDGDENEDGPPRIIATDTNIQDDVFQSPDKRNTKDSINETAKKADYQHLELPLRKGLASPLLARSSSPNPTLSRASSSEANDSLATSPIHKQSHPKVNKHIDPLHTKSGGTSLSMLAHVHNQDPKTMNVFSQVKNKVLNKQYWMKDENARDCFYCGDAFSTFRRKHHCSKYIT